jgi:hypothetical protein
MMDYTERLNKHISDRMKCFSDLKFRIELYQYHLREHENCEAKLVEASEGSIGNMENLGVMGVGSLDNSDIKLWNE